MCFLSFYVDTITLSIKNFIYPAKTVSTYKARLMKKLNVTNLVDLVNQAKLHAQDES